MRIVGPSAYTVGVSTSVVDPAARGGNPSIACQIQNSSNYQLLVNAGGAQLSIQPFWAQTVEISGQPIEIEPISGTGSGTATLTLAFLLGTPPNIGTQLSDGTWIEAPPQDDGSLTAAAITAAITGVLSTQGVIDLVGEGSSSGGGGPFPSTPFVALHPYQALLVVLEMGTAADQEVTAEAINQSLPAAFPPQTQVTRADLVFTNVVAFVLPIVATTGQSIYAEVNIPGGTGTFNWLVYGISSAPVVQVVAPTGSPLQTYEVGGGLKVVHNFVSAGTATVLGAPPSGFTYRLHRLVCNTGGTDILLIGVASSFLYGTAAGAVADNFFGLVAGESLEMSSTAAGSGYLYYDVIPIPTPQ